MVNSSETPIFTRYYGFVKWLFERVEKFPKSSRPVLGNRLASISLEILEQIVAALYARDKLGILREINLGLERLRILMRLAKDLRYISISQLEYGVREANEVGRMLGGWVKQQQKK
ncbi:MAG: diversity-generating retroelement protein Avd [Planctomycetota bacterium]